MAINKQTIISAFDDKLTLLQWLKTINKALNEAVLTGVEVRQKGNATYSFVVTFEDGTELVSNDFVLAQGESINGATIRNGHLYLSLTNGDELDAGDVKPVTSFEINASQHLIVNYGDGTSQDLGAIFSGNVNVDGNFTANSIIENMQGYSISNNTYLTNQYTSVVKTGNKITFVIAGTLTPTEAMINNGGDWLVTFYIPNDILSKIKVIQTFGDGLVRVGLVPSFSSQNQYKNAGYRCEKLSNGLRFRYLTTGASLTANTPYVINIEVTFLLSDNMAA